MAAACLVAANHACLKVGFRLLAISASIGTGPSNPQTAGQVHQLKVPWRKIGRTMACTETQRVRRGLRRCEEKPLCLRFLFRHTASAETPDSASIVRPVDFLHERPSLGSVTVRRTRAVNERARTRHHCHTKTLALKIRRRSASLIDQVSCSPSSPTPSLSPAS